jgi:hypothetical protein
LKLTPSGKADAEAFAQKHARGDIIIGARDHHGRSRCAEGGVACYYAATKTIYVDHDSELGSLAPTLYHEIRHALDPRLAQAHEKTLVLKQQLQRATTEDAMAQLFWQIEDVVMIASFESERDAYRHAYLVEAELLAYFPTYYFDMKRRTRLMYPRTLSDDEIVKRYKFDPQVIAKFKAGNCKELR